MFEKAKNFIKKYRHAWVLLYGFIYMPWFLWLEKHVRRGYYLIHSPLDDYIPFVEYFIIPYFLWFVFIAVTGAYFFLYGQTGILQNVYVHVLRHDHISYHMHHLSQRSGSPAGDLPAGQYIHGRGEMAVPDRHSHQRAAEHPRLQLPGRGLCHRPQPRASEKAVGTACGLRAGRTHHPVHHVPEAALCDRCICSHGHGRCDLLFRVCACREKGSKPLPSANIDAGIPCSKGMPLL